MAETTSFSPLNQSKTLNKQQTLQPQLSSIKVSHYDSQSSPFYTQIKPRLQEEVQLQNYIAGLRKQIKDAVWKQDLILQYNYMPLQSIKQKIQSQKQAYLQKMNHFKQEYTKILQNSQFTEELENLRSFNLKLKDKMKEYEIKIEEIKVKNAVIKADADQKRQRLKQLIKGNMDLSKQYVQNLGATNKQDIIKLVKAKSERQLDKKSSIQLTQFSQRKNSLIQRSQSARSIKPKLGKSLFEQSLDKLITEIKFMNTSSDIQQGIYLEIMDKKKNEFSTAGKISHRSTISNTLHQRYKPQIHKKQNKHYEQNDFEMDYQTFKDLNWKQTLGIMLIKDPDCNKLKNVFKRLQIKKSFV